MVLADFSKAFDTVCVKMVITKLHHLIFPKGVIEWSGNYLCSIMFRLMIPSHHLHYLSLESHYFISVAVD